MRKRLSEDGLSGYWALTPSSRFQVSPNDHIYMSWFDPDQMHDGLSADFSWNVPEVEFRKDDEYAAKCQHVERTGDGSPVFDKISCSPSKGVGTGKTAHILLPRRKMPRRVTTR
jgi:hypothetical protein